MVNGNPQGMITPTRGIRQGDPLSPYLFLFCAEAFLGLIQSAERNGRVLGSRSCRGSPLVSHLFFIDDSIVFCKALTASCVCIRNILEVYEKGSG